jgi:hypothetical protein
MMSITCQTQCSRRPLEIMLTRHLRRLGASVLLLAAFGAAFGACSKGPAFPPTIDFGGEHLEKTTSWAQGRLAGIVWTRPGEKLPDAPLQVGAIVSDEHQTAKDLNKWISLQAGHRFYDSMGVEETCRVGTTQLPDGRTRHWMTLITCQTGVGRASCVEADEDLPMDEFTDCLHKKCEAICDQRWTKRREALDILAAHILTVR